MNTFEIIKTVRLTEKGTRQGENYNQYTVVADTRANKTQIRQAVQVAPAEAVDHEHALAALNDEQLDVAVPGPTVAREVEQQMIGGGNRRGHVWRR